MQLPQSFFEVSNANCVKFCVNVNVNVNVVRSVHERRRMNSVKFEHKSTMGMTTKPALKFLGSTSSESTSGN